MGLLLIALLHLSGDGQDAEAGMFWGPVFLFAVVGLLLGKTLQKRKQRSLSIIMGDEGLSQKRRVYRWEDISEFYVEEPSKRYFEAKTSEGMALKSHQAKLRQEVDWKVGIQFGRDDILLLGSLTARQAQQIRHVLAGRQAHYLAQRARQ